jgi:TM2 domain-containing membrane protein YozV
MKRNPIIAGILSLVIPGLGQIYRGESNKGAIILAAAIVIGNLNIIILPLISMANPVVPPSGTDIRALWAYWIPRLGHDIISIWSIAFWLWAVIDALIIPRKNKE